jgi:hypothetical protein
LQKYCEELVKTVQELLNGGPMGDRMAKVASVDDQPKQA